MYENSGKLHRKGNAITPKSFETLYLNFETSNLKPVFTFCENCKFVSYELLGRSWVGLGRARPFHPGYLLGGQK